MPSAMQHYTVIEITIAIKAFTDANSMTGAEIYELYDSVLHNSDDLRRWVGAIVIALNPTGLLTGENALRNFEAIKEYKNLEALAQSIDLLDKAGLLSGENAQYNFDMLILHPRIDSLAQALEVFDTTGMNTQANYDLIQEEKPSPFNIAKGLSYHSTINEVLPPAEIAGLTLTYLMPPFEENRTLYNHLSQMGLFGGKGLTALPEPAPQAAPTLND